MTIRSVLRFLPESRYSSQLVLCPMKRWVRQIASLLIAKQVSFTQRALFLPTLKGPDKDLGETPRSEHVQAAE